MLTIEQVTTRRALKQYVEFPNQLYKDVPQYIPPMTGDEISDWDPKQNPAFEYCEGKCFLAKRDGKIVGRIGAILSHKANEKWGHNRMRFTQVDFIDDYEVSAALFKAVEDFAREKGCDEVHGPLGFTDLDREGMLVEGFDRKSMFITYYNHPYYLTHLERLGYVKDVDWIEYLLPMPEDPKLLDRMEKLSQRVLEHNNLHIAKVRSRLEFGPYIKKVFELWNTAYAPLYGTVELSDRQVKRYAAKFLPILDPRLVCFVMDEKEDLIAFGVSAPSMANALKKHNGRLFPFGFIDVLRALRKNDTLDLFLIAVRPEWRNKAINAAVLNHVIKGCQQVGIRRAETGPQLETNHKILSQWNSFSPENHKRRRCFIKKLDN